MQIFANAEWGEVVVRREKKLQLMLTHVRKIVQSIPWWMEMEYLWFVEEVLI